MNNEIPKLCGICNTELTFSRRDLLKINQLMKIELNGKYFISEELTLQVYNKVAHKFHTESK